LGYHDLRDIETWSAVPWSIALWGIDP